MGDSATPRSGMSGVTQIKFCGITRPEDAVEASRLGAAYVGAILADSPRRVNEERARGILGAAAPGVGRVAVFAGGAVEELSAIAQRVDAGVVQLHGDAGPAAVHALRARFPGEIWAVVSLEPDASSLPDEAEDLAQAADALMFDARVAGRARGTGVTLDWQRLADRIAGIRGRTRIILAGGLNAGNVSAAVQTLRPDIVDVSSGVESSPGVKDRGKMLAFAEAVRSASIDRGRTSSSSQLEYE